MSNTYLAFWGLIAWQLLMLLLLASYRLTMALKKRVPAGGFSADGAGTTAFGKRIVRVHANGYESIPFFLAVFLYAMFAGKAHGIETLAITILFARIIQGLAHLYSTSMNFIYIRFVAFFIQVVALIICMIKLI